MPTSPGRRRPAPSRVPALTAGVARKAVATAGPAASPYAAAREAALADAAAVKAAYKEAKEVEAAAKRAAKRADELADAYGERFRTSAYLRDLVAKGESFPA